MAEVTLTPAQQAVVAHRGSALLVSAAAGSGKTKVLVDRLLSMVCDPIAPKNVDDFLIITFTKAAATELRGKIAAALTERLSQTPENRHLQRQLSRLYLAQISTVHAFCTTLLRSYAHQLDIPADFRVAEEMECDVLRQQCLEQTLDAAYGQMAQTPSVQCFLDTLGAGRDDRAAGNLVLQMYKSALCHPDPQAWMQACVHSAVQPAQDPLQTPWGAALAAETKRKLLLNQAKLRRAVTAVQHEPKMREKYVPVLQSDLAVIEQLLTLETWEQWNKNSKPTFARMAVVRQCSDPQTQQWVKAVRKKCVDAVKALLQPFALDCDEVEQEQQETGSAIAGMFAVTAEFMKCYQVAKRSRHILDFSDLEQGAIRLLVQKGTRLPTATAKEISAKYAEIMVDEYQDTNEVQDLIFSAISRDGKNCFMVGDVKQSIYRFRMADPTIFLEKYLTYGESDQPQPGQPRKILLSHNFRSAPEILDAANCVFLANMSSSVGDLPYGDAELLRPGVPRPLQDKPAVELHCISTSDEEDALDKTQAEAAFVAERIVQLLNEPSDTPYSPGDITILLRSMKSDAQYYVSELQKRGLAVHCDADESILDTVESEVLTAILQVLDNPHQDIPLIAALCSPVFEISYDTLAAACAGREGDVYDALCCAEDPQIVQALETLKQLRACASLQPVCELLQTIDRTLKLRRIFSAMPNAARRVQNLDALFAQAAAFDQQKTLHYFLTYLDGLKEQGLSAETTANRNAVQIMSIHKSKGLEFPVVFLAGLSKQFNLQDLNAPVLVHPKLGVACNQVNLTERFCYPTAAKRAIRQQMRKETISEEMRILYVAMTRPKQRLVMTYCANKLESRINDLATELYGGDPREAAQSAKCMGDWVLLTALPRLEGGCLRQMAECEVETTPSEIPWHIACHKGSDTTLTVRASMQEKPERENHLPDAEILRKRLSYVYPYQAATVLPTKITATQLKGRSLDVESAEQAVNVQPTRKFTFEKPQFATQQHGLRATERGTATHFAMQFLRYEACSDVAGVQAELQRLEQEHFLTHQQVEAVDANALWRFFSSPLGQRVRSAKHVVREFKFSVLTDAAFLSPDAAGEKLLLQGVTDCCILDEDGITVLDFKTDRVRPGGEGAAAAYYRGQMEAYSKALSRIFDRPVKQRILYFFATDTPIAV